MESHGDQPGRIAFDSPHLTVAAATVSGELPNPVPGSNSAQKLTINGSNFVIGATVTYYDTNGRSYAGHGTTFVNSSQIIYPAFNDGNDAGTWMLQVVNPCASPSNKWSFSVNQDRDRSARKNKIERTNRSSLTGTVEHAGRQQPRLQSLFDPVLLPGALGRIVM